jgi:RimJ/RimL family protein N-acetyltransferase
LRYAFDRLGFEEVRAATDVPNGASVRVLERLGFAEWRRPDDGEHGTCSSGWAGPSLSRRQDDSDHVR